MSITRTFYKDNLIISINGRMDARFIQDQRENLESLPNEVKDQIFFDLSNADFIDSSGIGFLVYMFKRIKPENKSMAILGLNGQPKSTVRMLKIDRMIPCAENLRVYTEQSNKKRPSARAALKKLVTNTFSKNREPEMETMVE